MKLSWLAPFLNAPWLYAEPTNATVQIAGKPVDI
jgi:hypothetical protein